MCQSKHIAPNLTDNFKEPEPKAPLQELVIQPPQQGKKLMWIILQQAASRN